MGKHRLIAHPAYPSVGVTGVTVTMAARGGGWHLDYAVAGGEALLLPPRADPERTDGLWKTTCFELFVRPEGGAGYAEYNFAPSTRWAAYRFDGYRSGMRDLAPMAAPGIEARLEGGIYRLGAFAALPEDFVGRRCRVAITAVIEERDGARSFWSLAHPDTAPDFHHDACFALELPAASAP